MLSFSPQDTRVHVLAPPHTTPPAGLDPVTAVVVTIFHAPGAALAMATVLLLFALGLIITSGIREFNPLAHELRDRWNILSEVRQKAARKSFFSQFEAIDLRFSGVSTSASAPAALVLGWANYRSLLVENDGEFTTTIRAAEAFDRLDAPARSLEWWANILVSVGLVITFLGIVAALSEATVGIAGAAGDPGAMEKALMGLLIIAATKFWTSIAGVFGSIVLRVVARFWRRRIESMEANVFETLDACVQFMPPEKVMVEQLKSLERMEAALSRSAKGTAA